MNTFHSFFFKNLLSYPWLVGKQRPCHCHQIMKTLVLQVYCIDNDILPAEPFAVKVNDTHAGHLCGNEY